MAAKRKRLMVVCGKSGSGKSASLRHLANPKRVLYINCESGKELPFDHEFKEVVLTEPEELFDILEDAEGTGKFDTVVIDSLTFLMEMYETRHIYKNSDGFGAWNDFQQYAKQLLNEAVPNSRMSFIFLAHVEDVVNEETGEKETRIPVKGALAKNGLEAYFSLVVMAHKMPLKKLTEKNEFLNITKREKSLGFKHVFQVQITKETVGSRIRGPIDFWQENETYIDNDSQLLLDLLYGDEV